MTIKDRLVRTARGIGAAVQQPPYFKPGDYYSSATSPADREMAVAWRGLDPVGIDLNEEGQLEVAKELALGARQWGRYEPDNSMYGLGDAVVLNSMLRLLKPGRMLEIGSGYSTAAALDAIERYDLPTKVTCVEPNPERLLGLVHPDEVDLIELPVQGVPMAEFEKLSYGDILFIDSTHVVKSGSDVVWLYLHVLPRLPFGVWVHVHDVDWPFEYPEEWIREGRDWTEIYLLRALLTHTMAWEIRLMTRWLWTQHPEAIHQTLRDAPTGSLWMQKVA
jgi:hypothetical protein